MTGESVVKFPLPFQTMFGELKSSLPSEELSVETYSTEDTPDLQSIVYVARANDERIFLDTLPLPARDIVYGHLANRGHFEALANLRKVSLYFYGVT